MAARNYLSSRAWRRTRALVLARDGYRCQLQYPGCTLRAELWGPHAGHVDHVTPRRWGGSDTDLSNLRASCARCNLRRGDGTDPPDVVGSVW